MRRGTGPRPAGPWDVRPLAATIGQAHAAALPTPSRTRGRSIIVTILVAVVVSSTVMIGPASAATTDAGRDRLTSAYEHDWTTTDTAR